MTTQIPLSCVGPTGDQNVECIYFIKWDLLHILNIGLEKFIKILNKRDHKNKTQPRKKRLCLDEFTNSAVPSKAPSWAVAQAHQVFMLKIVSIRTSNRSINRTIYIIYMVKARIS